MDKAFLLARFQSLTERLSKSQKCGEFADFTLICEGTHFEVHKVIVCSQSAVLHAACTGAFKEASSGVYHMKEDSSSMVQRMISYFYTADYDESDGMDCECDPLGSRLQVHARMFALADKYDVEGLRALSLRKYVERLDNCPAALEFMESVPDVYTLTASSTKALREVVARFARFNLEDYLQDRNAREVYNKMTADVGDFVKDVLDLYMQAPLIGKCFNCGPDKPMRALQGRCRQCGRGAHLGC